MIKTNKQGRLIVISAPSGAGKDTVVNNLLTKNNNIWVSISCTSRNIRGNEVNEKDYFFLTKEQFEEKIKSNQLLEYAEYAGNYYGTLKQPIEDKLNQGIDVILVIEIQGALKIKELLPNTLFIFILPPSMKELKRRLINRKNEKIVKRFTEAYTEINEVTKYNYVVVNDEVEKASNKINSIIEAEKCRVDLIEEVFVGNKEEEIHELLLEGQKEFIN